MKKTVIIGASPNTDRAAYQAAVMLQERGHEFVPVGIKPGEVLGTSIQGKAALDGMKGVDTVTMYVRPDLQSEWYDAIFALNPKRIIFNPGTENPEFEAMARSRGIEATEACSLVLLSTGQF